MSGNEAKDHGTVDDETDILNLVEEHVGDVAVVYGTPPPEGRDLDLLVSATTAGRLGPALREHGFECHGRTWARFSCGRVEVVDITPVSSWGLSPDAENKLLAAAAPLPGRTRLTVPAPAHRLLIEARRLASSGSLTEKSRRRAEQALEEDVDAPATARREAPDWGTVAALDCLLESVAGRPFPAGLLRRARRQVNRTRERRRVRAALAVLLPYPRSGSIVSISGLDGSGKSGQATRLATTLETLGYETVVVWTRLGSGARLRRLADPFKRIVAGVLPTRQAAATSSRYTAAFEAPDPARSFRERSRLLSCAWAGLVTLDHVVEQRRHVRAHLRAGQVVICDRWTLDSLAHLRYRYGASTSLWLHEWTLRVLSPRVDAAFFLDVPGEVAHARKPDQYSAEQLVRQAAVYTRAARQLGVTELDGTLPVEDIADRIAGHAWQAVRARRRPFVALRRRWGGHRPTRNPSVHA